MDAEFDCELSPDQWEMLKALRSPAPDRRMTSRPVLAELIALGLATFKDERPVITAKGRKVLVRGSEKLLDLSACRLVDQHAPPRRLPGRLPSFVSLLVTPPALDKLHELTSMEFGAGDIHDRLIRRHLIGHLSRKPIL